MSTANLLMPWVLSSVLLLNAILYLPQFIKLYRIKSGNPFALSTMLGWLTLLIAVVGYGVVLRSALLIASGLVGVIVYSIMVFLYRCQRKYATEMSADEILTQLPGHIYWKNKAGALLGCNTHNWKDFGFKSLAECLQKSDYDIFPKDDADRVRMNDEEVMRTRKIKVTEEIFAPAKGQSILYLSHKAPLINKKGDIVGIVGVSIDITDAKRETVQRLKTLENIISILPGHIYWKDTQGNILGCNERQARDVGLTSPHDVVGLNDYDIINKNLPEETRRAYAEAIIIADREVMTKQISKTIEEPTIGLDGSEVVYLSQKSPLYNIDNQVVGLIGISLDITEQKLLEGELRQAKYQAEAANRLKSEFIRNMQHDIRTPTSGLKLMLSVLTKEIDLNPSRHLIQHAYNSATELLEICNEVTDFDNIKYSDISIYTKKFSLLKLAHAVIQLNAATAMVKTLNLLLMIADDVPNIIKGDEHRLKKILVNLLGNALKFTDKGQVSLTITVVRQNTSNLVLAFDVADSGIGIADADIDRIYERFTRLNPSIEGHFKGTGLGLYVVKQYVDELGGDIDVASEVGVGSHFVVTLPFKRPLAAKLPQQDAWTVATLSRQLHIMTQHTDG